MDSFLRHFKAQNKAEHVWLQQVYQCVRNSIGQQGTAGAPVEQLALGLVRAVQQALEGSPLLPLSYRPLCVSDLVTTQHVCCCSRLTCSGSGYRADANQAEQRLPGSKALPHCNLLLIGRLTDHEGDGSCDGRWRVTDGSESVLCKLSTAEPLWLQQLMLFPSWNFLPASIGGFGESFLELCVAPIPLTRQTQNPVESENEILCPSQVAKLLRKRGWRGGLRLKVTGQVCAVCPLIPIAGKDFFCFSLSEGEATIPVIVSDLGHLCWQQCLSIGCNVLVSGLRVCVLRGWSNRKVLSVTPLSRLHNLQAPLAIPLSPRVGESVCCEGSMDYVQAEHVELDARGTDVCVGVNLSVRTKLSRVINYRGVLTKLLTAEVGLWEIDGQLGLCLAYQPLLTAASELRPGVEIELYNVHFLYRPSAYAPAALLCACLRSTVRVAAFSLLVTDCIPSRTPAALRLLLSKNLGISKYLWICHCLSSLRQRLCPQLVKVDRVEAIVERLLDCVCPTVSESGEQKRDIYTEMLHEPHTCLLTEYQVDQPPCDMLSVQELLSRMERDCWERLPLSSLLPISAPHLSRSELNLLLAWSVYTTPAWTLARPPLLVGVLESAGTEGCLRLKDQTGAVECVFVETAGAHSYRSISNTAWLGCLVCIRRFTMVMERFLQTNFPNATHLDQEKYITHRRCRVYIQLCVDDVQLLSPSAAMRIWMKFEHTVKEVSGHFQGVCQLGDTTHHPSRSSGTSSLHTCGESSSIQEEQEQRAGSDCQRYVQPEQQEPVGQGHCTSITFFVVAKEGLTLQTLQTSAEDSEYYPSFCLIVILLGNPQHWQSNPKNSPLETREVDGDRADNAESPIMVRLGFTGSSVRWFPLLHVGHVFRMIAPDTQDPRVFSASAFAGGSRSVNLQVRPQWHFHTPSCPEITLPSHMALPEGHAVLSVFEVLHSSAASSLVTFEGQIAQRLTLQEEKGTVHSLISAKEHRGLQGERNFRLTVQDLACPNLSLQVYVDLSHNCYTLGLIPGAQVVLHGFQKKVSRFNSVYCRSTPASCFTVNVLGQSVSGSSLPEPECPMVLLSDWVLGGGVLQGARCRIRCHVVSVLSLSLKWTCSMCGSIFREDNCTQGHLPCTSSTAIFQAEAKAVVEDGSAEVHVRFSSITTAALLALRAPEWEGLQKLVKVRGHVTVCHGRSPVPSDDAAEDPLLQYLSYLCASTSVCRPITLTCQAQTRLQCVDGRTAESAALKRFVRGDREFITRIPPALQLLCTDVDQSDTRAC